MPGLRFAAANVAAVGARTQVEATAALFAFGRPRRCGRYRRMRADRAWLDGRAVADLHFVLRHLFQDGKVVAQHPSPPVPVMFDVVTPIVERCRNSLRFDDALDLPRVAQAVVLPRALPAAEDDAAAPVTLEVPFVVEVGQVVERAVEVDVIVAVVADEQRGLVKPR